MTKRNDDAVLPRRHFLKAAGVAGVTAAIAAVSGKKAEAATAEPSAAGNYRETDHVRTYYESTKF